jgi:hypothetical protein
MGYGQMPKQSLPSVVGIWSSTAVINGITVISVCQNNADGTFRGVATTGGVSLYCTGRYSYQNGITTFVYDNGWYEQNSFVWLNPNQALVTCLRSNVPGAVGLQVISTRVR